MNDRQVLYTSTAAPTMDNPSLHALRQESCANNSRFGVTGLLLYVDKIFVQLIEGPGSAIGQLFGNIRHDDRKQG